MNSHELQERTKRFAVDVINYTETLALKRSNDVLARQVIRSSSSVGANYREACQAESKGDFIHKLGIATKEAAETEYWLELLAETNPQPNATSPLLHEADEILRILAASRRTARHRPPARQP